MEQLSLYNNWKIFLEQPTSEKNKNNISTADKSRLVCSRTRQY